MKKLLNVLFGLLFLAGLGILLYPTVSDRWNAYRQSKLISSYEEVVAQLAQEDYDELWAMAHAYNETLWTKADRYTLSDEERQEYDALLDVSGNGIMGYIEIPSIDCSLPVYHGTDEDVLQIAVGHLEGTSLPVGGEGTHCVLSGHRGLPSAKLFTNLDQVGEGDIFLLKILGDTLTYEIDQILTVLPEETEALDLVQGEDYCTLVTCTPYGVNSHRLLVRGKRIENLPQEEQSVQGTESSETVQQTPYSGIPLQVAIPAVVVSLSVVAMWMLFRRKGR